MQMASSMSARQQTHAPSGGVPVSTTSSSRHLHWRQRLHLWCAARRCERLRRLEVRWEAQHERVKAQTSEGHLDYVTRTRPALGLQIHSTLS